MLDEYCHKVNIRVTFFPLPREVRARESLSDHTATARESKEEKVVINMKSSQHVYISLFPFFRVPGSHMFNFSTTVSHR